jgi:hypothetical protein
MVEERWQMADKLNSKWDEETLNAYLDGELDRETMGQIDDDMRSNLNVRGYIEKRRRLNRLMGSAFDDIMSRPMPQGLERFARSQPYSMEQQRGGWEKISLALAAGITMLSVGFGAGYFTGETRMEKRMLVLETKRVMAVRELELASSRALETTPSGQRVLWESPDARAKSELVPVRTLQTKDKQYCREFKEILVIDGEKEVRHGISCREGKAQWKTKVLFPNNGDAIF